MISKFEKQLIISWQLNCSLLSIQVEPFLIMETKIKPNVSFVFHVVAQKVQWSCAFFSFFVSRPVLRS